jgi:hypothetical protein
MGALGVLACAVLERGHAPWITARVVSFTNAPNLL